MTDLQRRTIAFATFFVIGVVVGLHFTTPPPEQHSWFFGVAVAGTIGGLLYGRAYNRRAAYIALALGGFGTGMLLVGRELDTRDPNHLVRFARQPDYREWDERPLHTEIYGCIGEDPDFRGNSTILTIDPIFLIELDEEGKPVRRVPVTRGRIQARGSRSLSSESRFQELAYGDLIATRETELLLPPVADNPGAFDQRKFLRSVGTFATVEINGLYQIRKLAARDVAALGLEPCTNALTELALGLRRRFTAAIKQTVPYPESAFVGGVLLGLRGGMEKAPYNELLAPFVDEFRSTWEKLELTFGGWSIEAGAIPTNAEAVYKATGTAHILAVSGFHVSIIAALMFGVLSLMRVPRPVTALAVVLAVWIFTLLVGFRPSTIRAATMTSIVAFSFGFLQSSLRSSSLFGLAVAAIVVLNIYPVAVTEASVTYSFGAILSLALLTQPFEYYLRRYVQDLAGIVLLFLAYTILCLAVMGRLYEWPPHWTLWGSAALYGVARLLRGHLSAELSFERLPRWLRAFLAAQLAMLAGLVFPLNSYYFNQLPIPSPLGNIVAIPALSVIVVVAMLAVIVMPVPGVGLPIALVLMAGTWFFIKYLFFPPLVILFWLIPWPAFPPPSVSVLIVYYLLLAGLAFHQDVRWGLRRVWLKLLELGRSPELARALAVAVALVGLAGLTALLAALQPSQGPARLSILHPYQLARGGGHPLLVDAPWGEVVLVDGGPNVIPSKQNKRATTPFDVGERIVASVLLGRRIGRVDTVVVSNFRHENVGGLLHVLEHFNIGRVVDPIGPDLAIADIETKFLEKLDDPDLIEHRQSNRVRLIEETYLEYRKLCARRGIPIVRAAPDMEIFHPARPELERLRALGVFLVCAAGAIFGFRALLRRERIPLQGMDWALLGLVVAMLIGLSLLRSRASAPEASLQVVGPSKSATGRHALEVGFLVLRLEYGNFSAILASDVRPPGPEGSGRILPLEGLRADVLVLPNGARLESLDSDLVSAVGPRFGVAVSQFTKRDRRGNEGLEEALTAYRKQIRNVYVTSVDGAVVFESDGVSPPRVLRFRKPEEPDAEEPQPSTASLPAAGSARDSGATTSAPRP